VAERVKAALSYATEVLEADAKFFSNNPIAKAQLEDMKKKDPVYIAHEFFNETWNPMHFSEVCEELSHAKLDHLGSSTLLDGLESIHLTPKAQDILRGASDKRIKGDLWDAFVSQRFRRDIFVKGLRAHIPQSRLRLLLKQRFVLTKLAEKLPATIKGARGTANLDQDLYGRIVRAFSEANAYILSVQDILASPECTSIPFAQLEQAIRVLVDIDMIAPVSSEETITSVKPTTERLNIKLCQDAAFDDSVKFLASPVTGSGVAVSRFEQLFIISLSRGLADPSKYIWQLFEAQGQRLQKEGKLLETAEANQAELQSQLDAFRENRLPLLHRLGIVSAEGKLDLSCEEPLKG